MSLYSDPSYYKDYLLDLTAPKEFPEDIKDLDYAFKNLLKGDNWNHVEFLRRRDNSGLQMDQKTNVDMKLSADLFCDKIKRFGYPEEAESVRVWLNGVGEYDAQHK